MPLSFTQFLSDYPPAVRAVARRARTLVRAVLPGAIEQVDPPSKIVAYGDDRTYAGLICAIAPYSAYVNLMFADGTRLPDPAGLLEGTGKRARHVKLRIPADVNRPAVRALLEAAVAARRR